MSFGLPVRAIKQEMVAVVPVFLAPAIALPLQRFGMGYAYPRNRGDALH